MASFTQTDDYMGARETILQAVLIGFSTIFFAMRVYARGFMTKTFGWDDALVAVAWVFVVVQSSLDIRAVTLGSGAHIELIPEATLFKFFESLVVQTLLYFWVVALVRISVLVFVTRLSQEKMVLYAAWAVGALVVAQSAAAFIYRLSECSPVADNFKPPTIPGLQCVGLEADQRMMIAHGSVGVAIDVALLLLPVYVIYSKMIFSKRAIQVLLILSVGVFVIVTGVIRLVMILTLNFAVDPTYKMATIGIWTNLEGHVGLWCSCFPALQPILRAASYKLGLRSNLLSEPTKRNYYAKGAQSAAHGNATFSRSNHGYVRNGSGVDKDGDLDDNSSQRSFVIKAGQDSVEMRNMEAGGIQKTTEVTIERHESKSGSKHQASSSWVDM
ncbi:hypothetical protein GQ53DRAFT_804326 [Thozetella sp. PMI_491]|nr:hypothetical protein GQ53DRAFT_804326 [Thozetella sp. PMI_491]